MIKTRTIAPKSNVALHTGKFITQTEVSIEATVVAESLYVFRKTVTRSVLMATGNVKPGNADINMHTSGFIDSKNLAAMRRGENFKSRTDLYAVPSETIERVRTEGFRAVMAKGWNPIKGDVFEKWQAGEITVANVVGVDVSNNVLQGFGRTLPAAIHCTGLQGRFTEEQYNLDKAIRILRRRSDVVLHRAPPPDASYDERNGRVPVATTEITDVVKRWDLGRGAGRGWEISFVFQPDQKQWNALLAALPKHTSAGNTEAMRKAMFDLDMLGLRKGKAALHDTYDWMPAETGDQDDDN